MDGLMSSSRASASPAAERLQRLKAAKDPSRQSVRERTAILFAVPQLTKSRRSSNREKAYCANDVVAQDYTSSRSPQPRAAVCDLVALANLRSRGSSKSPKLH